MSVKNPRRQQKETAKTKKTGKEHLLKLILNCFCQGVQKIKVFKRAAKKIRKELNRWGGVVRHSNTLEAADDDTRGTHRAKRDSNEVAK